MWIDDSLSALQARFNAMQNKGTPNGARLGAGPGADGRLGTPHYSGLIDHPGGTFRMREFDDVVADGIWSFLGPQQVGSNLAKDFFLEVTSRPWADGTVDEPSRAMAAGKVAVEAVIARCTSAVKTVTTVQAQIGTGPWRGFDSLSTSPMLDPKLLTPAL